MRRPRPLKHPARQLAALIIVSSVAATACSGLNQTVALSGDPRAAVSPGSIPAFLMEDEQGRFTTLLACAGLAGAVGAVSGPGPLTLFAPTNDAFRKAGVSCEEGATLAPAAAQDLLRTLQQHVVGYDVRFTEPEDFDPANPPRLVEVVDRGAVTLDSALLDAPGTELVINANKTVRVESDSVTAKIIDADLQAPNGVVQVIDTVLQAPPKSPFPPTTSPPPPYG